MKKSILITTILLISLSVGAFANVLKSDTAKSAKPATSVEKPKEATKPEFKLDPNKVYHITLDLTEFQINALTGTSAGIIARNPQLSGDQIGQLEDEAKDICKLINRQRSEQINKDYKAFQSDTAKASKKKSK